MGPAFQDTDKPRHFTLLRSFHLADFFTLANGSCGTAAIFFASARDRDLRVIMSVVLLVGFQERTLRALASRRRLCRMNSV